MRFQTDDIIESQYGSFLKVQAILGEKVVVGHLWANIKSARKDQAIGLILTEARLATLTVVERDGKDYDPERWMPEDEVVYYYPDPASTRQIGLGRRYIDSQFDRFLLDNGLCYSFTEEGRQAAIARTKRMLAVK